jgi:hypothetical protein
MYRTLLYIVIWCTSLKMSLLRALSLSLSPDTTVSYQEAVRGVYSIVDPLPTLIKLPCRSIDTVSRCAYCLLALPVRCSEANAHDSVTTASSVSKSLPLSYQGKRTSTSSRLGERHHHYRLCHCDASSQKRSRSYYDIAMIYLTSVCTAAASPPLQQYQAVNMYVVALCATFALKCFELALKSAIQSHHSASIYKERAVGLLPL